MTKLLLALTIAGLTCGVAVAQSPAPTKSHAVSLIKLPNGDYTVPMSTLQGSEPVGTVTLHPEGLKTLVVVNAYGMLKHRHEFHLHAASDCDTASANAIALAPAMPGQQSRTLISLPLNNLVSKNYVIDAHDATQQLQFKEACARL
jgi:Cu/Zn superoxide dismutase